MVLPTPRVKPLGWGMFEILASAQETQLDLNISLLDQYLDGLGTVGIVASRAIRNWHVSQKLNGSFSGALLPFMVAMKTTLFSGPLDYDIPVVLGAAAGPLTNMMRSSNDALVFDTVAATTTAFNPPADGGFSGMPGVLGIFAAGNNEIQISSDYGNTWTAFTYGVGVAGATCAQTSFGNRFLFALLDGTVVMTSTVHGSPNITSVNGAGFVGNFAGAEFACDLASPTNFVLCAQAIGDTFAKLYHSGDGGTTWAAVRTMAGLGNVLFSQFHGLFIAWDTTGVIYTSPTGVTWSTHSTTATTANGFENARGSFAAAGGAIAKLATRTLASSYGQSYVAFSFDLGLSWNFYSLPSAGDGLGSLIGSNGRLYVMSSNYVWHCDILEDQEAEL